MSGGEFIRYNHSGIDDGFKALSDFVSYMEGKLDELEKACAPIVATWESEAARTAYDEKKASWNQSAENIKKIIVQVGGALASSSEEMAAVDKMAAARFS